MRRPTRREVLLGLIAVTFLAAMAAIFVVAYSARTGQSRSGSNERAAKTAKRRAGVAEGKSRVAERKADQSLQLNVKLVRCLTKQDAAALRRCLGLRVGAPGRPGAGGLRGIQIGRAHV